MCGKCKCRIQVLTNNTKYAPMTMLPNVNLSSFSGDPVVSATATTSWLLSTSLRLTFGSTSTLVTKRYVTIKAMKVVAAAGSNVKNRCDGLVTVSRPPNEQDIRANCNEASSGKHELRFSLSIATCAVSVGVLCHLLLISTLTLWSLLP